MDSDTQEIVNGMGKFVEKVTQFYGGSDNIPGEILHGIEVVLRTVYFMGRKAYEEQSKP